MLHSKFTLFCRQVSTSYPPPLPKNIIASSLTTSIYETRLVRLQFVLPKDFSLDFYNSLFLELSLKRAKSKNPAAKKRKVAAMYI